MRFCVLKVMDEGVIFFLCVVEVDEYDREVFEVLYVLFEGI